MYKCRRTHKPSDGFLILLLPLLGLLMLGPVGCERQGPAPAPLLLDPATADPPADVRIAYRLLPDTGWQDIESLTLWISRLEVDFERTRLGCDDPDYLRRLQKDSAGKPKDVLLTPGTSGLGPLTGPPAIKDKKQLLYFNDLGRRALILNPQDDTPLLPLAELAGLPSGFIVQLRLFVEEAHVVRSGVLTPLDVPKTYRLQGLRLAAREAPIPICKDDIAAVRFDLHAGDWLSGAPDAPELLAGQSERSGTTPHVLGTTTAPVAVFTLRTAQLDVPARQGALRSGIRVDIPPEAVPQPKVIRVKVMDLGDAGAISKNDPLYTPAQQGKGEYQSADPVFRKLMVRIGEAYDLRPDGFRFDRPISIALPAPLLQIPEGILDSLPGYWDTPLPGGLLDCLRGLNHSGLGEMRLFMEKAKRCIDIHLKGSQHPARGELPKMLPDIVQGFDAQSMALYTWSPAYRLWLPDVPRLLKEHHQPVIDELDRVIELERSSADSFEPDFSAIPQQAYAGLRLDFINNRQQERYLITDSNHFCTMSLFADLNVGYLWDPDSQEMEPNFRYEPLLDGALDDMCQTTGGFGFPRDSNKEVHCGGDPASEYDLRRRVRKTKRIIQRDGVALRFRDNVHDYFDARAACPAPGSAAYCYDLEDFEDDVRWAVNTWREAINRDPDGGWTERFQIDPDCWQTASDDEGCSGREFDLGIKDLNGDAIGKTYGRNINLDEALLVDPATQSEEGRLRLRTTLLHEMGHALGLDHWAGAGTLMSYNGRDRRNDLRFNLCAPYSRSQFGGTAIPTDESEEFCRDPTSGNTWGNTCTVHPVTCTGACTVDPPNTLNGICTVDPVSGACTAHPDSGSCTFDAVSGRINDFHHARINRLTCTDVQRIRQQVRDADTWTSSEPLRCEITADRSSYAAVERQFYDAADQQAYHVLELDLRFRHCGDAGQFNRMEFELLGVDVDNDSNVVTNLYKDPDNPPGFVLSTPLNPRDADDYYNVTLTLESRNLAEPTTTFVTDPVSRNLVEVFPSFTDYIAGANLAGLDPTGAAVALSYERLAMIIRTYEDTTTGGLISDYVAGSTGLLRAPFLDFVDQPFSISMTDLRVGGSRLGHPLVAVYENFVAADDWFPYIDSPIKKPNVGRVLYVVVPPPAAGDPYGNFFGSNFEWTIPNQSYNAWAGAPQLLWVHSVEVTRGFVPTVGDAHRLTDWPQDTEVPLKAEGVMTRRHPGYFEPPSSREAWDPCRYLTDTFELDGSLSAEPLHTMESPLGNPVEVWDLFWARFHYAYLGVGDADPSGTNPCPTSGNLCATGQLDPRCVVQQPQEPDRHFDFYFSVARPAGAIVQPSVDRLCRYNACPVSSNSYTIGVNVKSVALLAELFPKYEFQVRIHGTGDPVDLDSDPHIVTEGWIDMDDARIDEEGNYSYTGAWLNNKDDSAYDVTLDYRYCVGTDTDPDCLDPANWTQSTLDRVRLRFDKRCDCDHDRSHDYQDEQDQCCDGDCCGD